MRARFQVPAISCVVAVACAVLTACGSKPEVGGPNVDSGTPQATTRPNASPAPPSTSGSPTPAAPPSEQAIADAIDAVMTAPEVELPDALAKASALGAPAREYAQSFRARARIPREKLERINKLIVMIEQSESQQATPSKP